MRWSDERDKIATALVGVQAELKDPGRDKNVNAGPMRYKYTTLESFLPGLRRLLAANGCVLMQDSCVDGSGGYVLVTSISHASGQWVELTMPIIGVAGRGKGHPAQEFGSAFTYSRRYAALAAFGLAPDGEDDDGAAASTRPPPATKEHPSWAKDKDTFLLELEKLEFKLAPVTKYCVSHARPSPQAMDQGQRDRLVHFLANQPEVYLEWEKANGNG